MQEMLSKVADWSGIVGTFVGLPALGITYWQVYKARKEATEARKRNEMEGMVKFVNIRDSVGVNIIPFKDLAFLPRVGEIVLLPGTSEGMADYRVVKVHHICFAEPFGDGSLEFDDDARTANVRVEVEPIR